MKTRWRIAHVRGYLMLGMLREAEAELKLLDENEANLTEVLALRVAILHERRSWRRLRALTSDLVKSQPEEPGWWVSFAYASRRIVSIERARNILLDAVRVHPREAVIHFNLACYAAKMGDLGEARRRLKQAIELDGNFAKAARADPDLEPLRSADGDAFLAAQ